MKSRFKINEKGQIFFSSSRVQKFKTYTLQFFFKTVYLSISSNCRTRVIYRLPCEETYFTKPNNPESSNEKITWWNTTNRNSPKYPKTNQNPDQRTRTNHRLTHHNPKNPILTNSKTNTHVHNGIDESRPGSTDSGIGSSVYCTDIKISRTEYPNSPNPPKSNNVRPCQKWSYDCHNRPLDAEVRYIEGRSQKSPENEERSQNTNLWSPESTERSQDTNLWSPNPNIPEEIDEFISKCLRSNIRKISISCHVIQNRTQIIKTL